MNTRQKGQDLVEFALLLPVFLVFIVGIMYVGFVVSDYMTLNTLARVAAREAVVSTDTITVSDGKGGTVEKRDFTAVRSKYENILRNEHIKTSLYVYQENTMTIDTAVLPQDTSGETKAVRVQIPLTLNEGQGFVNAVQNIGLHPNLNFTITYYMYDENAKTTQNS